MEAEEDEFMGTYHERLIRPSKIGFRIGEKITPIQSALYQLYKNLEKYNFSDVKIGEIQEEFEKFPNITVVDLNVLAAVLYFLQHFDKPTRENFEDETIKDYFEKLIPIKTLTEEEKKKLFIRLKFQFIKYYKAIKKFRTDEE